MKHIVALVVAIAVLILPTSSSLGSVAEVDPEPPSPWDGYEELKQICTCESGLKHSINGEVILGRVDNRDTGICQISRHYWGEEAEKLGYDLFKKEDNISMAKYIYDNYGPQPWYPSRHCHGY